MGDELFQLTAVVGKQDDGNVQPLFLDHIRELDRRDILNVQRRYDQVEAAPLSGKCDRFPRARYACELRRVGETESLILMKNELIETSIFLEKIEVVQAGNQEDLLDPLSHQVLKPLKAAAKLAVHPCRFGHVSRHNHGRTKVPRPSP